MSNLQPPHYESGALPIALLVLARVVGLEPTAPCSQSMCATNCATPGYGGFPRLVDGLLYYTGHR